MFIIGCMGTTVELWDKKDVTYGRWFAAVGERSLYSVENGSRKKFVFWSMCVFFFWFHSRACGGGRIFFYDWFTCGTVCAYRWCVRFRYILICLGLSDLGRMEHAKDSWVRHCGYVDRYGLWRQEKQTSKQASKHPRMHPFMLYYPGNDLWEVWSKHRRLVGYGLSLIFFCWQRKCVGIVCSKTTWTRRWMI